MSLSGKIFKKRGPTRDEIIRETKIKRKISSELSSAIKSLQQEHCSTGEAILSSDTANHVCNILEAVFLHGLKNSVVKKLGKYVGLQNGENADQSINFWSFATKFTHKDTTAQLTRLGQITTEIGLCRAWIRVALNDGIMTSYVDALMADKKTLMYFYHGLAYLNDFDQQEIFKSLLKGLMTIEFKLSYNSRVLNSWTNTPLIVAGIIEIDDTPLPVVQSSGKHLEEKPVSRTKNSEDTSVKVIHSHRKSGHVHEPKTPPNTPFNAGNFAQGFTRQDVENLKHYTLSSSPQDTEYSSSSHISCPDPVKYNLNPAVYVDHDNKDDVIFTLNEEEDQTQDSFIADDIESVIKRSNELEQRRHSPVNVNNIESVIKCSDELEHMKISPVNVDNLKNFNGLNDDKPSDRASLSTSNSPVNFSIENEDEISYSDRANEQPESILKIEQNYFQSNDGEISSDLAHNLDTVDGFSVEHSREDHNARILADILGDKSNLNQEPQSSPDQSDSGIADSPSSISASATTSPVSAGLKIKGKKHKLKPDFCATKHESAPEMSPAVANSIETSKMKFSKHRYSLPIIKPLHNSPQNSSSPFRTIEESQTSTRPRSESDKADDIGLTSPSSVGNSLGAASGWSSSFQLEAADTVEPLPESRNTNIPNRPKAESFGSLLKNYTPSSSVTSPSLEDVLQDLPESSDMSPPPQHVSRIYELEDDTVLIEGYYEIASSMSDVIAQSKLKIIGEIANEKGLDAQNYQCKGCTRPVGLIYGKPRVCTFDAGYYCFECHENDEYYIPAMLIHNWDFRKHPVAKCNYKFLQDAEDQTKVDISKVNPKLYEHVKEMEDLRVLRTQLYYLKTYLFTCKQSIADEFRQTLWPREYMYENIHLYSLSDFLQVPSGTLLNSLKKVIKFAIKHVYECRLCSQKGYICELCNQTKVIYPFEVESTIRCKQCKSVFHKTCKIEGKQCPKCLRKQQRRSQMGSEPETPDSQDYAYVPQ